MAEQSLGGKLIMAKKKLFPNLPETAKASKYMLGFIWKDGKPFIFLTIFTAILDSLFLLVYTIFPGLIINELTGNRNMKTLALYVGVVILTPLFQRLIYTVINRVTTKQRIYLHTNIIKSFYTHTTRMDYESIESPEIQEKHQRALQSLDSSFRVVENLSGLLSAFLSFVAISSLIISLNPLIIVAILLVVYLNSIITKRIDEKVHLINIEIDKNSRQEWGATYMLENIHYAKELRLFNLRNMFIDFYEKVKNVSNGLQYQIHKDRSNANLLQAAVDIIKDATIYVYLIYLVIRKGLGIGDMSIYMNAANQFSSILSRVVNTYLNLANNSLQIQELIAFMNLPLRQYESGNLTPQFDRDSVIEFKNVSFKYPGSERYALKNLSITLHGNEKLCIVGENGAGKSTFIKLLTRLYFPTEGAILLNGINITEYDIQKYQRLFAPVFQDFAKYYMTFGENIVLSDEFDKEKLDTVCKNSGLSELVAKLPKGYNTYVDKWIDPEGFEPSGGENQRIAIARACYHGGDVFLLDEPTAALDPIAEYEIYTQFSNMITDKCAVLITHRLSAVQLADKVAVFDGGNVVEYGTHKELYAKGGIYTEMFNKQAKFYRDEPSQVESTEQE